MANQLKFDEELSTEDTNTVHLLWQTIRDEVLAKAQSEPVLNAHVKAAILDHDNLADALAHQLASIIQTDVVSKETLTAVFAAILAEHPGIVLAVHRDLKAVLDRDPACDAFCIPFLFYKGFHGIELHRIAHQLWIDGRAELAMFIQYQVSTRLGMDVHPAASIGSGIMIDHGTGIVIGETAVIGDNVSLLQGVTLGGTGKETGQRHPKIKEGVLIGAGAKILGNVTIGRAAKVGAGSVVLSDVPEHVTVAGVPAKIVGKPKEDQPAFNMDHLDIGTGI